jgi:hypothetical protein
MNNASQLLLLSVTNVLAIFITSYKTAFYVLLLALPTCAAWKLILPEDLCTILTARFVTTVTIPFEPLG